MRSVRFISLFQILFVFAQPVVKNLIIGVIHEEYDGYILIPPNKPYHFTVFGNNLPDHGYQFTTVQNCEDIDKPSDLTTTVNLTVKYAFDDWAVLYTKEGIPFTERDQQFQLCNKLTVNTAGKPLTIRSSHKEIGYWRIAICICLLCLSAIFSALLLAYMRYSINEITDMSRERSGVPEKIRVYAEKILPYRSSGNYLICSFAAANTIVNVLFTIYLNEMFVSSEYERELSYTMPSLLILVFGEVLPQSIALQYSLPIAANFRLFTKLSMILMWPIAKPLSMFTDCLLGKEAYSIYTATELQALWKLKAKKMDGERRDIINRIFDLPSKTVHNIMTPLDSVFLLNLEDTFDDKMLFTIMERGYTRIPVFTGRNRNSIAYVINVKDVAGLPNREFSKISDIINRIGAENSQMRFVPHTMQVMDLMQEMGKGNCHICAVVKFIQGHYKVIGMVTFEDILEELFGEIEDDTDRASNNRRSGMHKDQKTLDWFRAAAESNGFPCVAAPLPVVQHIHIIYHTLEIVPQLSTLGFKLFEMKDLLCFEKMRTAEEGELLSIEGLIIIYEGYISYGDHPSFEDHKISKRDKPFILGAYHVRSVLEFVASKIVRFEEPPANTIRAVKALKPCKYFSIDQNDILKSLEQFEESFTRKEFMDPLDRTPLMFSHTENSQETPKLSISPLKKRWKDVKKGTGKNDEKAALLPKNKKRQVPKTISEKSQGQSWNTTGPSLSTTQSSRQYP